MGLINMRLCRVSPLLCFFGILTLITISACGTVPASLGTRALDHLERGLDYFKAEEYSQAKVEFTKAIDLGDSPDTLALAYGMRGLTHYQLGDIELALKDYDAAIAAGDSDESRILHYERRGDSYQRIEQWQKAVEDYNKVIELDPDNVHVLIGRGFSHHMLGNAELAIQDLEAGLRLEPNHANREDIVTIMDFNKRQLVENTSRRMSPACIWFANSQLLRSERITGATGFLMFIQKYGSGEYESLGDSANAEFISALEEYIRYAKEFVDKWQHLGFTPEMEDFYNLELAAEKQRLSGLEKMLEGLRVKDDALYQSGIDEFEQARPIARSAESAMLEIRATCLDELEK